MKTGSKWTIGILGGFFAFILICILILPFLIDPNDYKDKILGFVEKQTGRQVDLQGDIDMALSMGLDVVFNLGQVEVSGISPFADTTFAKSERVEVELGLLPLLVNKELSVSKIMFKGVHLNLIQDKNGTVNWKKPATVTTDQPTKKKEKILSKKKKSIQLPKFNLGGIQAEDISVTYDNRQSGQIIQLSSLSIDSGPARDGKNFPCKLSFHVELKDSSGVTHSADIAIDSNFMLDSRSQQFLIKAFKLDTSINSEKIPELKQPITFAFDGNVDLKNGRADLTDVALDVNDTKLTGQVAITNFSNPAYTANLRLNTLDVDRYRKKDKKKTETPFQLPIELLKALSFQLNLSVDKLKLFGINLSNVKLLAEEKDRFLRLSDLSADLYGGSIKLHGELDVTGSQPKLQLFETLDNLQVQPLLKDMKDTDAIEGLAKVEANIKAVGKTDKEMIKNMNGDLSVELRDGMIRSLQIIKIIRIAKALYLQKPFSGESADEPTGFAQLTATGKIKKGVFYNYDLRAHSDLMKVTGEGQADLVNETVDYKLDIYLASRLERDTTQGNVVYDEAPILYTVKGPFSNLDQSADVTQVLASEGKNLLIKEVQNQMGGGSGSGSLLEKGLKFFGK